MGDGDALMNDVHGLGVDLSEQAAATSPIAESFPGVGVVRKDDSTPFRH